MGLHISSVATWSRTMNNVSFVPTNRLRASRAERAAELVRLWLARPALLARILAIEGAPSKWRYPRRWLDLASRMLRPMCCVTWDVDQKVARIVDHHRTAHALGGILAPGWDEPRKLMDLPMIGPQYSIKIDEAYWMTCDGLTTISLWHGIDRMFTMGFMLSSEASRLSVYVGSLQGRNMDGVLPVYREMTKDAKGMRPRDLMVELHRMFCRAIGVTQILAVADMSRSWNDRFADEEFTYIASLNYDEAWTERGGKRHCSNWFSLPVDAQRRAIEDISAKKRGLYRQRYAMLDAIEKDMTEAIARLVPGRVQAKPAPQKSSLPTAITGPKSRAALLVLAATAAAWPTD